MSFVRRNGQILADVDERMANMEKNMEKNTADIKADMERKLKAVNNEVKGLKKSFG